MYLVLWSYVYLVLWDYVFSVRVRLGLGSGLGLGSRLGLELELGLGPYARDNLSAHVIRHSATTQHAHSPDATLGVSCGQHKLSV